jgi:hypothetical protein
MQWLFGSCRFRETGQERICTYLTSSVPLSRLRTGQLAVCFDLRILLRLWMVYILQISDFIVGSLGAPGRVDCALSLFPMLFCLVEHLVGAVPVHNSFALLADLNGLEDREHDCEFSRFRFRVQSKSLLVLQPNTVRSTIRFRRFRQLCHISPD